ncbi:MAG: TlpA family protein disulfide reductase [Candidatus Kapabacteria bacterium]|nr:TlpA family protein disulfide reductase [Ignavibacteriota bacterium]MCW5885055.1 TlpA family protein disulfide reductase [Candidatus Kapabacteria bacterium]
MKYLVFLILIFILIACTENGTGNKDNSNRITGCEPELYAPKFKSIAIDNSLFELDKYYGKVILLDFWATWCIHCNYSRPMLKLVYDEFYADTNFVMFGISVNDKPEKLLEYLIDKEIKWTQIQNSSQLGPDPKTLFCVDGIPTVIIIDKDGKINSRINPNSSEIMIRKIKECLQK